MKRPTRYAAGVDGIAHAHPSGTRGTTTACGLPSIGEPFAWPTLRRCATCEAFMADRERQARQVPV
jgi:hypothetical protein